MDRRAFLKSVLGVAGATALPAPIAAAIEALEPVVALPSEPATYTLSFFFKGIAGQELPTDGAEYHGWRRAVVPIRADCQAEAIRLAEERLAALMGADVMTDFPAGPTLERNAATPYIPTAGAR